MSRPQFPILLLTVLLFAAVAPMQRPSSAAQPTQQSPSFRVGVDVVSLSVTVIDRMTDTSPTSTCPNSPCSRMASSKTSRFSTDGSRVIVVRGAIPAWHYVASSGRRLSATDDETRAGRFALLTGVLVSCAIQRPIALHALESQPTFSAGIALVPITAVVRDSRNQIVRDLRREDFQVLEHGHARSSSSWRETMNDISVAFLFDTDGSMPVASNLEKVKDWSRTS